MIEFEPGLTFFPVGWYFFLNLGANNRCAINQYTIVEIGLD